MSNGSSILCPAHRCKPGSMLLGVREDSGMVAILPQALPIDENFIDRIRHHEVPPEQRFRFTNKCAEGGCRQWNGKGCSVVERVVEFIDKLPAEAGRNTLSCGIRSRCRWYIQRGEEACTVCPYVLTELTAEEVLDAIGEE